MTFESELTDKYDLITTCYFNRGPEYRIIFFFSTQSMNIGHYKYFLNYYKDLIAELWLILYHGLIVINVIEK